MKRDLFNYIDRSSPVHRMTGASKLLCLLLWSVASMTTYDARFLLLFPLLGIILLRVSRIRLREVSFVLGFMGVFLVLNTILLYVFSPEHGCELYGTRHVIFGSGHFAPTWEQVFYQACYILKFLAMIPAVLLFVTTTQPSEFAASLSRIGVSYRISYAVALALRYIPDVQQEYTDISRAQQARGIAMGKKAHPWERVRNAGAILVPLILSSMRRIEVVSNAMELRGFGKKKKRTWYMARPFGKNDFIALSICVLLVVTSFALNSLNGSRFWNPFA